MMKTTGQML